MTAEEAGGPARLAHLCRHPIKAIGYEDLSEMTLTPGAPAPWDRRWAVAHGGTDPDSLDGRWISKHHFLRGVAAPALMAVRAHLEAGSGQVTLRHPHRPTLTFGPDDPADTERFLDWIAPLWPEGRHPPTAIVRARGGAFGDWPDPYVAIVNLASQRALSARMGTALSAHRWRANLWLDGLPPWSEFDLVGSEIAIGSVRLRVAARITRCRATCGNPETGEADADTLSGLQAGFGHQDFGVYGIVTEGGALRPGDPVRTELAP